MSEANQSAVRELNHFITVSVSLARADSFSMYSTQR
jgi:hypothetical protein